MKVLLIGGGGREHALAWRLRQCPSVSAIVCPNGSPGIAQVADTPAVTLPTVEAWADFARREHIDLAVVGPELPLAHGVTDAIEARGIAVFGPSRSAARIEASKTFAKDVMHEAGIPTAQSASFREYEAALEYGRGLGLPVVVKADGLAAGKGVRICTTDDELKTALRSNLVESEFGAASATVLVEEFLEGEEVSILALTDGREVLPLVPAQDHKRALDGDRGPNTGGMGAYAPTPAASEEVLSAALTQVLRPCIEELARRGIPYKGVLYAGLILTPGGPRVLEFNCRFGDPETQCVLPLVEGDLAAVMMACCEGRLGACLMPGGEGLTVRPDHAVCVVAASGGYPGKYEVGLPIEGLDAFAGRDDCAVFHAGTRKDPAGRVVTAGGRVLGLTAWAPTLDGALFRAYEMADAIRFDGMHVRRDIAHRALQRKSAP